MNTEYTVIDGHRVQVAGFVGEARYGRQVQRLDAPYGYKASVMTVTGKEEICTVYAMPSILLNPGPKHKGDRYACVKTPKSDPLVAYRCFRIQ